MCCLYVCVCLCVRVYENRFMRYGSSTILHLLLFHFFFVLSRAHQHTHIRTQPQKHSHNTHTHRTHLKLRRTFSHRSPLPNSKLTLLTSPPSLFRHLSIYLLPILPPSPPPLLFRRQPKGGAQIATFVFSNEKQTILHANFLLRFAEALN